MRDVLFVTGVVPYLRNDTWPLSAKTNSYEVERGISKNSMNPLSCNYRDVMSFMQALPAKLPLEPLGESRVVLGTPVSCCPPSPKCSGFSACVPEFLTDSLWDQASCPRRLSFRFHCHALVISHQNKTSIQKSSERSREESLCGSQ